MLTACTTEEYKSGDGYYSYMRADFAVAYTDADGKMASVMLDSGDSVTLASPYNISDKAVADSSYRGVLYYNINDGEISPRGFSGVVTLHPYGKYGFLSTAYDPMGWESMWISKNRSYLNLSILPKMGTEDGNDNKHAVGLLMDTVYVDTDGTKTCSLKLLHWQNDVPEYYTVQRYLSIPIADFDSILTEGDKIQMTINTYDGEVVKTISY